MSRLKLVFCLNLALLLAGCVDMGSKAVNLAAHPSNQPVIQKMQNIRGVIQSVSFGENGWCYDIKSIDTSNDKLPDGEFCGNRHYFNAGDLVYTNVFANKIKNMHLIQSNYENSKKPYKNLNSSSKNSNFKRAINKKQIIQLPKNEKISFD